ncbi:HPF/RaiA family ribosome-associated protein [Patescibacteria group bacterium]
MKLQINSGKIPLSGTVENLIRKNLGEDVEKHLQKFKNIDPTANVHVIKRSRFGFKVLYDLPLPGKRIFSEEKNEDLHKAIRKLKYEVIRQIKRHKDRLNRLQTKSSKQ